MSDDKNFRYIVRVGSTDLKGTQTVLMGLQKIKGVGYMMSNAMLNHAKVDKNKKVGELTDAEVENLTELVRSINKLGLPTWMLNRRKDVETGADLHLSGSDLVFTKDNDIKMLQKIKSYRGSRHAQGLPSRGQRTKSNFRRNKGKAIVGSKKTVVRK